MHSPTSSTAVSYCLRHRRHANLTSTTTASHRVGVACYHDSTSTCPLPAAVVFHVAMFFSPHPPHLGTRLAGMLAQSPLEGSHFMSRNVNLQGSFGPASGSFCSVHAGLQSLPVHAQTVDVDTRHARPEPLRRFTFLDMKCEPSRESGPAAQEYSGSLDAHCTSSCITAT